jgi:hypothetical protein
MSASPSRPMVETLRHSLRRWQIVGGVFGSLAALTGIGIAVSPALWFETARTEGTVAKLEPSIELVPHGSPQAGDIVWYEEVKVNYPVVEYHVGDQKFNFRSRSSLQTYRVGEKVPVRYRVSRPGDARLDTFTERWLTPLLVGGTILLLGLFILAGPALIKGKLRRLEAELGKEAAVGKV